MIKNIESIIIGFFCKIYKRWEHLKTKFLQNLELDFFISKVSQIETPILENLDCVLNQ